MAAKKRSSSVKTKPKTVLQNLAARPPTDDVDDEPLVDHSGVFRVTTQLARAQVGRAEEAGPGFASDSLVMAAQRDGFRDDGTTMVDALDDHAVADEAGSADKRQRLATVAARAARPRPRSPR